MGPSPQTARPPSISGHRFLVCAHATKQTRDCAVTLATVGFSRSSEGWRFLGARLLRYPSGQCPALGATRRAFGNRPLIDRQGLGHAFALLLLLLHPPVGPRRELLLLRRPLPLHGVPPRPLYRDSIVALCPVFALGRRARMCRNHSCDLIKVIRPTLKRRAHLRFVIDALVHPRDA
jgi:hypothetical protein